MATTFQFGYIEAQLVVFRESFTGTGAQTTFQLTGAIGNATFSTGTWAVSQVERTMDTHATDTDGSALYDGTNPLTKNRVLVSSISAGGLVTLSHPPILADTFYIWYWYDMKGEDDISAYYRDDFVASMEASAGATVASLITTDTSGFNGILSASENTVQKALDALDNLTISSDYGLTGTVTAGNIKINTSQDLRTSASPIFVTVKLSGLTDGYIPYHVSDTVGLANSIIYQTSSKIGIGTTAVACVLDVVGSNAAQFRLRNVTTDATLKNAYIQVGHYTNTEEDVCILVANAGTSNSLSIGGSSSVLNTMQAIYFYTAADSTTVTGTERMRITSTGAVGIGCTPTTGYTLDVNGRVRSVETIDQETYAGVQIEQNATTLQDGAASTGVVEAFDNQWEAMKFTASAGHVLRSIKVRLKVSVALTNPTASLSAYIYADSNPTGDGGSPTGSALATSNSIAFGSLTTSMATYNFGLLSATLTSGSRYWVVLKYSAAPTGGTISIDTTNAGTGEWSYSADGTSWTNEDGKRGWYQLFGRTGYGVYGYSLNRPGVYGVSANSYGVWAASTNSYGVYAASTNSHAIYCFSTNAYGVNAVSTNSYGVFGQSTAAIAVYGRSTSAAGVAGQGLNGQAANFYQSGTLTAANSSNTVLIRRYGVTNVTGGLNYSGTVLQITDNPTGTGAVTGALISGQIDATTRLNFDPRVADGAAAVAYMIDTAAALTNTTSKLFEIRNAGTANLTLLGTGNLGIMTATPVARLEVEDAATAASMLVKITQDDANVYGLVVGNDTYSTTDTNGLRFIVSDTGDPTISWTGTNFYLGTSGDLDAFKFAGGDLFVTAGTISCSDLTDGYVPVHTSDAVGLANSAIYNSGTLVQLALTDTTAGIFKVAGTTGRLWIIPYYTAGYGTVLESVVTAENAYIPMSLLANPIYLSATSTVVGGGVGGGAYASTLHVESGTSAAVHNDVSIGGRGGWAEGEEHNINAIYDLTTGILGSIMFWYSAASKGAVSIGNLFTTGLQTNKLFTVIGSGNVGIATTLPVARLEVEDAATTASMLVKITQDDGNVSGLIIGNDTYSTTDTNGLKFKVTDAGVAIIDWTGASLTLGSGAAGVDYLLTFDGETNDGTITWMEDENWFTFNRPVRMATSLYRRYYHVPLSAINPGATGPTWTNPGGNLTGGWRLDAATEILYGQTDVHADWDAASDLKAEVRFAVNINNTGGGAGDTVDLKLVVYYNGVGDTVTKSQTVEVATIVGASAQYKQFEAVFTIDYDYASNVVEVGDVLGFALNLETDTSEVDDIILTDISFSYKTTHVAIEDGDE